MKKAARFAVHAAIRIVDRMNSSIFEIKDRNLGDEWKQWQGDLTAEEQDATTHRRLFLSIALLIIGLSGILLYFFWYLITPRLSQFHELLPAIAGFCLLGFWFILFLGVALIVLSVLFKKDLFLNIGKKEVVITGIIPWVMRTGLRLGISRDRLGNSFVNVSNSLIRNHHYQIHPDKLLILLPRCLSNSLIKSITEFGKQTNIHVHTVSGGSLAREIIKKVRPEAIIGVACERDLLSGIQDVILKIPVLGIPNKRPNGPCKNTQIDLQEMEYAIQTFLGKSVHIPPC